MSDIMSMSSNSFEQEYRAGKRAKAAIKRRERTKSFFFSFPSIFFIASIP